MKASIRVNTATRNRLAQTGELVGVRLQPEALSRLDDWRRQRAALPGRPEVIRRLVELGLKAKAR